MQREIRGITFSSFLWEAFIFGGFISANEFALQNLIQAYEWFFYFSTVLAILFLLVGGKTSRWQYTKMKYRWEIITNTLLGIMLAYYGYFVCASILTFAGYVMASFYYFSKGEENEKAQ